ncbi:MAG TPA: response regulator transcription factor [Candidatus Limnocylindria bacterium]|nr:response regulator transcription factor [Candidatus Limnocylindria bacterium]
MSMTDRRRLRVLVADDHASVRENLRYLINAEADLECVGVVKDGARCIELCRELVPDVLVLDNTMPRADGVTVTRTLARGLPEIRVVMYTLDDEICPVARAFGAVACVSKDSPYEYLLQAIRNSVVVEAPLA